MEGKLHCGTRAEGWGGGRVDVWCARAEGEMIYLVSPPSLCPDIFVSVKFASIKSPPHPLTAPIAAFHYCLSYKPLSVRCNNIKYSSNIYTFRGRLHPIQEHPSYLLGSSVSGG